jgi:hypothetical protein
MLKRITRTLTVATKMEILVLINKKSRRQNEGFIQGQEDMSDGATAYRDIIERAGVAGINASPILEDIIKAVRNVNSSNPDGICTDSDVELVKKLYSKSYNSSYVSTGSMN